MSNEGKRQPSVRPVLTFFALVILKAKEDSPDRQPQQPSNLALDNLLTVDTSLGALLLPYTFRIVLKTGRYIPRIIQSLATVRDMLMANESLLCYQTDSLTYTDRSSSSQHASEETV
jgi:hypothetical protein